MKTVRQSTSVLVSAVVLASSLFVFSCRNSENKSTSETAATTSSTTAMNDSAMAKMKADSIAKAAMAKKKADSIAKANAQKPKAYASVKEEPENTSMKESEDKSGIYNRADVMPQYPGGKDALDNYIQTNIQYPREALHNDKQGTVFVKFAIDENGKVIHATTVGKPLGYGLEEEALRVINDMPAWTPGTIKGKPVKVYVTLPINYSLVD